MAGQKAVELKSDMTADEIEAGNGPLEVRVPLTLDTWVLADAAPQGCGAVVTSADGDKFIGRVTGVNEERRLVRVELS